MIHSGSFVTSHSAEEVFDLLANPVRFAPLLPDFESMSLQDPTHFTVRIMIAVARINGHAILAMESRGAARPSLVEYHGQGTVAGSQLTLRLQFRIAPSDDRTEVNWQGEFSLDGMLSLIADSLIEPMGRRNFDRMAERLRTNLLPVSSAGDARSEPEIEV